uniref:Uncharacterized protein n=1 Tax=Acrobeloides nanus TaxID=290746 RepID=A0A914EL80_9BILA
MSKRARVDREKRSAVDSPAEQQDECVFYDKVIVSQEEMDAELEQKKMPKLVRSPDGWYRHIRDYCENCTRYNFAIATLMAEWCEDVGEEYRTLPPPMPTELQTWKFHYSVVTAGTCQTLVCEDCKVYNEDMQRCPPQYLADGWVRSVTYSCPRCFRYMAAIVDKFREGWMARKS